MLHLSTSCRYYFYNGPTDMRKGFDSLSGLVHQHMGLRLEGDSIFIFFNRKRNQVKLLHWEGDGLCIFYKRLEKGTYELPATSNQGSSIVISAQQLQFILQGVSLQKIQFRPRYKKTG